MSFPSAPHIISPQSFTAAAAPGRWPLLAQLSWTGVMLIIGGLYVLGIPLAVERFQQPCPAAVCEAWMLTPEKIQVLRSMGMPTSDYAGYVVAIETALALTYAAVGGLLVWRRGTERMAVFAGFALLTFGGVTLGYVVATLADALPLIQAPATVLHMVGAACFTVFLFVVPDGQFVPRWTRWVALPCALVQVPNPLIPDSSDLRAAYLQLTSPFFLVGICSAFFAQVYRYRRVSSGPQRQQTKWTVLGFALALGGYVGLSEVVYFFPSLAQHPLGSLASYTGQSVFLSLVPVSIGLALLRHRLYDVDVLINRTLVYGALTATVVGVYVLVLAYVGTLFQARGDALSLLAAAAVALVIQPLRARLQRGVNHLLYGQRDEPYAVLSGLGKRLEAALSPEAVLPTIVATVREALKLPYAAIALEREDAITIPATSGMPVADPVRLPLVYRGEAIGHLLLAPRAVGETFTPADRRLLEDLGHQAGVAAHAVQLTADLQSSREKLVNAREEERRRLRRDLHDGLGPALAAHTLKVGAARALLPPDAQAADHLLAELEDDIEVALADIRRLVYELRPPALDELGLLGAIRESAAQYAPAAGRGGQLTVRVEAPERLPPLPAAVEVAAYRIVQESLANIVRHADARSCRVELAVDSALHLTIVDDGVGLPTTRRAGVGLMSMRERAAELGGTCVIESAPAAGTCVRAELPLP